MGAGASTERKWMQLEYNLAQGENSTLKGARIPSDIYGFDI